MLRKKNQNIVFRAHKNEIKQVIEQTQLYLETTMKQQ